MADYEYIKSKINTGEFTVLKRKAKSEVYNVFYDIKDANGHILRNLTQCSRCKNLYKTNERCTSNLLRHHCYKIYKAAKEVNTVKVEASSDLRKQFMEFVLQWIVGNCRPCNIVNDDGLHKLIEFLISTRHMCVPNLDVKSLIPNATTVARNMDSLYYEQQQLIKEELCCMETVGFSVTCDLWSDSSIGGTTYIGITIHYIRDECICNKTLGMREIDTDRSNDENLYKVVDKFLADFGCNLNYKSVIVTKRDLNTNSTSQPYHHIFCIVQLLKETCKKGIGDVNEATEIVNWCTKFMKYIKTTSVNPTLTASLENCSPAGGNIMINMLDSIQTNWDKISTFLNGRKCKLNAPNCIDIDGLKDILKILEPFEGAIKNMECDSYATLHLVYIYIHQLKKVCTTNGSDSSLTLKLKEKLQYYVDVLIMPHISIIHKLAVFLFPPTNKLLQFSLEDKREIENECEQLMLRFQSEMSILPDASVSSTASNFTSKHDLFSDFVEEEHANKPIESIRQELQLYRTTKVVMTDDFNVYKWWYMQKNNFPLLYKISCIILSTPASSSYSERVFSRARNLLSENSLDDVAVNRMIFLHYNTEKAEPVSNMDCGNESSVMDESLDTELEIKSEIML